MRPCEAVQGSVKGEEADFGQSRFGHPDLANLGQSCFWPGQFGPKPIWANPILAIQCGPFSGWCFGRLLRVVVVVVCAFVVVGLHRPLCTAPSPGPPPPLDRPKFLVFFPLPPQILFFFPSLGGPFVEFEAPGPSNVHVWALGLSCEAPQKLSLQTPPKMISRQARGNR